MLGDGRGSANGVAALGVDGVGAENAVDAATEQFGDRAAGEDAVSAHGVHFGCTLLLELGGCGHHGSAAGNHVVKDRNALAGYVQILGFHDDFCGAEAGFFHVVAGNSELICSQFCVGSGAFVGCEDHVDAPVAEFAGQLFNGGDTVGTVEEEIENRFLVRVHGDHLIGRGGEGAGHGATADRFSGLEHLILPCVSVVRDDAGDFCGPVFASGVLKEQQFNEVVVGCSGLHEHRVFAFNFADNPGVHFAIGESVNVRFCELGVQFFSQARGEGFAGGTGDDDEREAHGGCQSGFVQKGCGVLGSRRLGSWRVQFFGSPEIEP